MAKKQGKMKKSEIKAEMEAIKKLKSVASILNADEMENAFLQGSSSASESMDDSVAGDVLNSLHGKNIGIERLEKMEADGKRKMRRRNPQGNIKPHKVHKAVRKVISTKKKKSKEKSSAKKRKRK